MVLWKICRAINNEKRLELLREIALSPRKGLNVVQAGGFVGLRKAAASQYLRHLAEAGFLSVERSGKYVVCYSACEDESPSPLNAALSRLFKKNAKKKGWCADVMKTVNAFAHYVRPRIVYHIAKAGSVGFADLAKSCRLAPATLRRQLAILIDAGVVLPGEDHKGHRLYAIAHPQSDIVSALVSLSRNCCT